MVSQAAILKAHWLVTSAAEYTSVELHACGYKSIPAHHIQTDITRCEWPQKTVCNNKVSFLVAKEDPYLVLLFVRIKSDSITAVR